MNEIDNYLNFFKSKIHRARVTEAELNYEGSITIDADLLDASGILPSEKVQVVNVNNGERLETYVIEGERGSGIICLNGPAARKCAVGDYIIIIAYFLVREKLAKQYTPKVVFVDNQNRLIK
ncbi:aspartate 1-decarboxylase [Fulvivirga sp. 29W222]|uniref:Aspartate 1-decarboxylase n=1 Tax=Fulvivirga marina TaxID=2494733 RepID=A0A937KEW1_9BACT|nr:aspartate 1-decarboxylase [Fulvivirga marina]MBL6447573.1 aspartate 1-decarboxylase [Fulvivirga marina]